MLFLKASWWSRTYLCLCSLIQQYRDPTCERMNSGKALHCKLSLLYSLQALLARLKTQILFLKQLQQSLELMWKIQSQSLT